MSLSAGTTLGRYEIRSKIGEGGMGERYQEIGELYRAALERFADLVRRMGVTP